MTPIKLQPLEDLDRPIPPILPAPEHPMASGLLIVFGVLLPAFAIGFEWITGACTELFFDPIPTPGHAILLFLVPFANLAVWVNLRFNRFHLRKAMGWLNALALGVSWAYALLYLPLTPFALIGILAFGFGFLPLSPLLSAVCALILRRQLRRWEEHGEKLPHPALGISLALSALVILQLPVWLTKAWMKRAVEITPHQVQARHYLPWMKNGVEGAPHQVQALHYLRRFGHHQTMLQSCYFRPTSERSLFSFWYGDPINLEQARTIFYRVTGTSFNEHLPPTDFKRRTSLSVSWDPDQGGESVGGQLVDVNLNSSRLDGWADANAACAYLEWILEIKNNNPVDREGRAQIQLPPGAVVSRVTLWVNGEEQEAAYAGRAEVRQAYQAVVQQRRDPVLVTTSGPDRILVQCFPIPRQGGTLKFKLGLSLPLQLASLDKAFLVWPQIIEHNFGLPESTHHTVWLETSQRVLDWPAGLIVEASSNHVVRGSISTEALQNPVYLARNPNATTCWAPLPHQPGQHIEQLISLEPLIKRRQVVLVCDRSAPAKVVKNQLRAWLNQIPDGVEMGVIATTDQGFEVIQPLFPLTSQTRDNLTAQFESFRFVGGQDNTPALEAAWDLLSEKQGGVILWLHAAQPVLIHDPQSLAQRLERRPDLAQIVDLQLTPGKNRLTETMAVTDGFLRLTTKADMSGQLAEFASWLSPAYRVPHCIRQLTTTPPAGQPSSDHLARLWANQEVKRLLRHNNKTQALQLATSQHLVTSISGAVVLENKADFERAGLKQIDPSMAPTVPEPSPELLMILGLAALLTLRVFKRKVV